MSKQQSSTKARTARGIFSPKFSIKLGKDHRGYNGADIFAMEVNPLDAERIESQAKAFETKMEQIKCLILVWNIEVTVYLVFSTESYTEEEILLLACHASRELGLPDLGWKAEMELVDSESRRSLMRALVREGLAFLWDGETLTPM